MLIYVHTSESKHLKRSYVGQAPQILTVQPHAKSLAARSSWQGKKECVDHVYPMPNLPVNHETQPEVRRSEPGGCRIDYGKNCKGKVSPRCLFSIETVETLQVLVSSLDIALRATIVFKQKFAVAAL